MKAIILCGEGEEGLAPLTLERPLPLLSLFDKPLLAHQAGLLRRHGVREIGVALPRLSRMVEDAMGDGEELGVRFTWLPCRGAGELELLAACAGFLGEEDALVLPGGGLGVLGDRKRYVRLDGAQLAVQVGKGNDLGIRKKAFILLIERIFLKMRAAKFAVACTLV